MSPGARQIEDPKRERLGNVGSTNGRFFVEIGDRSGDAEHSMDGAIREAVFLSIGKKQLLARRVRLGDVQYCVGVEGRVAVCVVAVFGRSKVLCRSGEHDFFANLAG